MKSRARLLVVVALVVFVVGLVGWLGSKAYVMASELHHESEAYLAMMTLVVTVVAMLAAGMGLGGSYIAWRVGSRVAEVMKSAEQLKQDVDEKAATIAAYDAMIQCVFGGWQPAGMLLAHDLRLLTVTDAFCKKHPESATELTRVLAEIRQCVERNAVLGAHAVQLFVSTDRATTESSAQALAASGRREASRLLARRIEIEERKRKADPKLIRSLSYLQGTFSEP